MTNLNQNGRSMIEMLGVLAIIGVLSVGGIAGYSKAMMKFKTNKTIDQIAMTVTNIRTLYAQQPNYDITTTAAWDMGVVDDAMKGTAATGTGATGFNLKNAFNGPVYIESGKSGAVGESGNGAFIVTFAGLPREACVAIATNDWGSNYSSGLLGVGAGHGTAASGQTPAADVAKAQSPNCYVVGGNTPSADTSDKYTNLTTNIHCVSATDSGPFLVSDAATACECPGNNCFVTFKYY